MATMSDNADFASFTELPEVLRAAEIKYGPVVEPRLSVNVQEGLAALSFSLWLV